LAPAPGIGMQLPPTLVGYFLGHSHGNETRGQAMMDAQAYGPVDYGGSLGGQAGGQVVPFR
jgi:hypothetical protein